MKKQKERYRGMEVWRDRNIFVRHCEEHSDEAISARSAVIPEGRSRESVVKSRLPLSFKSSNQPIFKSSAVHGFTLVEMVVTLLIIITLSLLSFPLYKGRSHEKSKIAEGYALLGTIISAQVAYYNEYGNFYAGWKATNGWYGYVRTVHDPVLGINAINNRYFSTFLYNPGGANLPKVDYKITAIVYGGTAGTISLEYNITKHSEPVVSGV